MIKEKNLLKTAKINRPSSFIHPNPYFRKEQYSQIDLLPIFSLEKYLPRGPCDKNGRLTLGRWRRNFDDAAVQPTQVRHKFRDMNFWVHATHMSFDELVDRLCGYILSITCVRRELLIYGLENKSRVENHVR